MSTRIAIQLHRASLQFGTMAPRSCFGSMVTSSLGNSSNPHSKWMNSTTNVNPIFISKRTFFTSLNDTDSSRPSHDHAQFHTANSNDVFGINEDQNPGSRAFGECEISALSDLFLQFAQTSSTDESGVDDMGPYLNLEGIRQLLASVGEKPDDETLKTLFDSINMNKDGKLRLDCFLRGADQVLGNSPARIVLVVGGPGSGKGELCKRLEKDCGAVHLSCGELLRSEVEANTPLGREVRSIMESGGLVSSAVVTALMRRRMRQFPGKRILLDGFPRSLENARDFVELCGPPELALHLDCDDTILMERILARGSEGDGQQQRSDDNIHTALNRLKTYHKHHRPTMDWLKSIRVPIVELDCSGSKEEVWSQLVAIGRLMRPAVKIPPTAVGQQVANNNAAANTARNEASEDMQWFA